MTGKKSTSPPTVRLIDEKQSTSMKFIETKKGERNRIPPQTQSILCGCFVSIQGVMVASFDAQQQSRIRVNGPIVVTCLTTAACYVSSFCCRPFLHDVVWAGWLVQFRFFIVSWHRSSPTWRGLTPESNGADLASPFDRTADLLYKIARG